MVESKVVCLGDTRIEYLVQGAGLDMLLLPSLGRGAHDYDEVCDLLVSEGVRTIRPQPRGVGGSSGAMVGITMTDLAQDVAAVIEAECIAPVAIAGHAFGNFVARMVATIRPDVVSGVAMVAGSAGKTLSGESPYDPGVTESIAKSGDLTLSDGERLAHLRNAFFAPASDPSVWLDGWYPATKAAQLAAQKQTPLDFYFAAGDAPIFELQAYDDTVADRRFGHTMRTLFGSRVSVKVVMNAGHALVPEQPQATAQLLSVWVHELNRRS